MIENILKTRRSVRCFKTEKPPRETLEKLIEMASMAPSASNKQPWRFFIIEDRQVIETMAQAVETAIHKIELSLETAYQSSFTEYGNYFVRFREAPIVIVPIFKELTLLSHLMSHSIDQSLKTTIEEMEFNSGLLSIGLAIQNLLLFAHSINLGTSCMTGPLIAHEALKTILEVPSSWKIAALIAVGYADEEPLATSRKMPNQLIRWITKKP